MEKGSGWDPGPGKRAPWPERELLSGTCSSWVIRGRSCCTREDTAHESEYSAENEGSTRVALGSFNDVRKLWADEDYWNRTSELGSIMEMVTNSLDELP